MGWGWGCERGAGAVLALALVAGAGGVAVAAAPAALPTPVGPVTVARCSVAPTAPAVLPFAGDGLGVPYSTQVLGLQVGAGGGILYSDYGTRAPLIPADEPLGPQQARLLGKGGAPLTGSFALDIVPATLPPPTHATVTAVGGAKLPVAWSATPESAAAANTAANWQASFGGVPVPVTIGGNYFVGGFGGGIDAALPADARSGTLTVSFCGSAPTDVQVRIAPPVIATATAEVVASSGGPVTVTEGQPITVTGSGFPMAQGLGVGLYLGGTQLTNISAWSGGWSFGSPNGSITAVVPPSFPPGTWPLTVHSGAGVSNSVPLAVDPRVILPPAPTVTAPVTMTQGQTATATASPARVTWASSNPGVLRVTAAGVLTAEAPGSSYVVATDAGGKGSALVRVQAAPAQQTTTQPAPATQKQATQAPAPATLASLSLPASLRVGATATAVAAWGGSTRGYITWTSTAPGVAAVNSTGQVTAVAPGTATIRAALADGSSASAPVTVQPAVAVLRTPPTHTTTVTPRPRSVPATHQTLPLRILGAAPLAVGGQEAVTASPAGKATWLSTDPRVAAVTAAGVVTGRAPGIATIEATRGGQVARATVRVAGPAAPVRPTGNPLTPLLETLGGAAAAAGLLLLALAIRRRRRTAEGPTDPRDPGPAA